MNRIVVNVKWKPFNNFDGYFVSNNGLVKKGTSLLRLRIEKRSGYLFVIVTRKGFNDKLPKKRTESHHYFVHVLVWDHFGLGRKKGYEIHHKDFNFLNNHIDNLGYILKSEHYRIHGKIPNKSLTIKTI